MSLFKFSVSNLLLLLFCACSSAEIKFEKNTGKTNEVIVGKAFHVNLAENHSTGYSWSLSEGYDFKLLDYVNSVYHSTNSGNVDFNFKALKTGKTELTFISRMHTDTGAIKSFVIEIK